MVNGNVMNINILNNAIHNNMEGNRGWSLGMSVHFDLTSNESMWKETQQCLM